MKRTAALAGLMMLAGCATGPEIQGHRGARGLLPENSIPAFMRALDIGVDVLELDTGITRDGVVVVSHDPCLNADFVRRANGAWLTASTTGGKFGPCIVDMTFAELQQYDVGRIAPGSDYARRFPVQQAVDGTRIPTLADLFNAVRLRGDNRVRFNIETKISPLRPTESVTPEVFVEGLLSVIRANRMESRVTIQSFDWRTLKIAQRLAPAIPTVYLSAQQKWQDNIGAGDAGGSAWTAGLKARDFGSSVPRMVHSAGGAIWSPYFGDLTQAKLAEAHSLGLKVVVWTVNEPNDIARMLQWKVDGIISDYPDRVKAALQKRL